MGKRIEKIKSAGRYLAEKAASDKGKYISGFVPYLAESVYWSPLNKKRNVAAVLALGSVRMAGLINPALLSLYLVPTALEEGGMLFADSIDNEFKKAYENKDKV